MTIREARKLKKGDILRLEPKGWYNPQLQEKWENTLGTVKEIQAHQENGKIVLGILCNGLHSFCPWAPRDEFWRPAREFVFLCHAEDWQGKVNDEREI